MTDTRRKLVADSKMREWEAALERGLYDDELAHLASDAVRPLIATVRALRTQLAILGDACSVRNVQRDWPALEPHIRQALEAGGS